MCCCPFRAVDSLSCNLQLVTGSIRLEVKHSIIYLEYSGRHSSITEYLAKLTCPEGAVAVTTAGTQVPCHLETSLEDMLYCVQIY